MIDYILTQLAKIKKIQQLTHESYKTVAHGNEELAKMIEYRLSSGEYAINGVLKEAEAELNGLRKAGENGLIDLETLDASELARFAVYMKQLREAGIDRHDFLEMVGGIYSRMTPAHALEGYITSEEYAKKYGLSERHLRVNRMFHRVIPIQEIGTMIFIKDRPLTEGERLNLNSQTYLTLGEVATLFKCDQTVAKLLIDVCEIKPAMPTWAEKYNGTTWYHGPDLERMKAWLESAQRVSKKGHSLISFMGLVWCEKCGKSWKTGPRNECDLGGN